ncbi:hypothetical protein Cgig2_015190 [Carnegiea gigantea]|uniref:Stress-related protein n=1 Tax=Carnegiea gigantea TaxID=171969 RepID=A0A9Q1KSF6_9CARY|nr:hypothetical protein Cgig2_015190 [Carnegiea gigantea]
MKGSNEEQRLKYLDFVHAAALHAIVCFSNLYCYAKDKAGPLKPSVETVEGTVKTIVGPVYQRFHGVPFELLKFVDRKLDGSVTKLEPHLPPVVRQLSSQAYTAAQKAPEVARSVASEVQRAGVIDTASGIAKNVYTKYEPTAKELYSKYEPVAEQYAVSAWRSLNRLPLFPQVAQVVVPTAAYCSEKYNQTVKTGAEKGYRVANYLPLVPTERIAKVFGPQEDGKPQPLVANANGAAVAAQ